MDSDDIRPVVLALLAVVAIGLAAATLNSAVVTDPGGGPGVGAPDPDTGAEDGGDTGLPIDSGPAGDGGLIALPCYPVLDEGWAIGLLVGGFLLGGYAAYRRLGLPGFVAYAGPVGFPILFLHALLTACVEPSGLPVSFANITGNLTPPEGGSGIPGAGDGTTLTDPSVLLLVGLGLALLASVVLLFVSSSGTDPEDERLAEPDPTEEMAAVGRAAGEAADRIEASTDVDNEVFRAWREMTDHLDVPNPESSTPAEFAAAAVEAGMARRDVEELTGLFEAVRYGGESPTADREERAVAALRRIEETYAEGGGRE